MATCTAASAAICGNPSATAAQQQLGALSMSSSQQAARLCFDDSRSRNLGLTLQQQRRKSGREGLVCRAASYQVTLRTPEGETVLTVPDDQYILDAAEDNGVSLPYSCRSGACSSCAAVVKSGKIDQSNQTYLEDSQVEVGYVLTCVAYPLSDIVLETHKEHALF